MRVAASTLWAVLALLALGGACQQGWAPIDDTETSTDTQVDTDALDDELQPLERCEGYTDEHGDFYPIAGATVWWYGELYFTEDGSVGGREWAELRPNAEWRRVNPEDAIACRLPYEVAGTKTELTSTRFEVLMDAFLDEDDSTCARDVTTGLYGEQMNGIRYTVVLNCAGGGESCEASLSFAPSGNDFAEGVANAEGMSYHSDPLCAFF
jgi:hypothetical protein